MYVEKYPALGNMLLATLRIHVLHTAMLLKGLVHHIISTFEKNMLLSKTSNVIFPQKKSTMSLHKNVQPKTAQLLYCLDKIQHFLVNILQSVLEPLFHCLALLFV